MNVLPTFACVLLAAAFSLNGCLDDPPSAPSKPPAKPKSVRVGGQVNRAGELKLPADGLTLLEAIQQAGGVSSAQDKGKTAVRLVLWKRCEQDQKTLRYLPWSFVEKGAAGELPLQPGDSVDVVPFDETQLGKRQPAKAGAAFTAIGRIESPGQYQTREDAARLAHLTTPDYVGAVKFSKEKKELILLTHQPSPGVRERYFLPLTRPHLKRAFLLACICDGDHFHFARIDDLPLFKK